MTVRRKEASSSAETTTIVEDSILKFNEWWGGLLQGDVIKRLRQRFEDVRCAELGRYAENRSRVPDDDRRLIERISETLVARILHEPTVALKEGDPSERIERAAAVRVLFGLG
jgi:glutamyl-tRNA reductase